LPKPNFIKKKFFFLILTGNDKSTDFIVNSLISYLSSIDKPLLKPITVMREDLSIIISFDRKITTSNKVINLFDDLVLQPILKRDLKTFIVKLRNSKF